jgi:hypothetical protein
VFGEHHKPGPIFTGKASTHRRAHFALLTNIRRGLKSRTFSRSEFITFFCVAIRAALAAVAVLVAATVEAECSMFSFKIKTTYLFILINQTLFSFYKTSCLNVEAN